MSNKNNFVNPEYKIVGDSTFLPFTDTLNGVYDPTEESEGAVKIGVVKNVDGSNGVSMYNGDQLIVKTVLSEMFKLSYDKEEKIVEIKLNPYGPSAADSPIGGVEAGNGIKIDRYQYYGKEVAKIGLDSSYIESIMNNFVKNINDKISIKGRNGIKVLNDEDEKIGRIIELDDNYIIQQGEF